MGGGGWSPCCRASAVPLPPASLAPPPPTHTDTRTPLVALPSPSLPSLLVTRLPLQWCLCAVLLWPTGRAHTLSTPPQTYALLHLRSLAAHAHTPVVQASVVQLRDLMHKRACFLEALLPSPPRRNLPLPLIAVADKLGGEVPPPTSSPDDYKPVAKTFMSGVLGWG